MGHLGQGTSITTVEDKEIILAGPDGELCKMNVKNLTKEQLSLLNNYFALKHKFIQLSHDKYLAIKLSNNAVSNITIKTALYSFDSGKVGDYIEVGYSRLHDRSTLYRRFANDTEVLIDCDNYTIYVKALNDSGGKIVKGFISVCSEDPLTNIVSASTVDVLPATAIKFNQTFVANP